MSRFTKKIKGKDFSNLTIIILAAGAGARTKSYEPRCLLKYNQKPILDYQLEAYNNSFKNAEIVMVCGCEMQKVIKKYDGKIRFVENQIHYDSNSGESMKIGIINSKTENVLIVHGDLIFDESIFENRNYSKSFLLFDCKRSLEEKEVGIYHSDSIVKNLSYDSADKWTQIAFLSKNELNIFKKMFYKNDVDFRYLLSFEIINKIIDNSGEFSCYDIKNSFIKEIDSLKDINNEDII